MNCAFFRTLCKFLSGVILLCLPLRVSAQTDSNISNESIMITLVVVSVAAIIFFIIRAKRRHKKVGEKEAKQKLDALRAQGQELHSNREEALNAEDIQVLRKYVEQTSWIALIILGLLGIVFLVFMEGFGKLIGLILLILIYPTRKYMFNDLERVLSEGKKQVIRGIVTDRFTTTSGTRKERSTHYWLTIGEEKFEITSAKYGAYAIGDAAEFHTTDYPKGKQFILRDERLEGAGLR